MTEEKEKPNLFERWKMKILPTKIQREADRFFRGGRTDEEKIFRAGYMCGKLMKEINKRVDEMENKLIEGACVDTYIDDKGKQCTINYLVVGRFDEGNEEEYFRGELFDEKLNPEGEVTWTKEDFEKNCERWEELPF